jgi:hypothetical protein
MKLFATALTRWLAPLALLAATSRPLAAPITWGTPATIASPADVSTNGTSVFAYDWNSSTQTVNGVAFTAPGASVSLSSGFAGHNFGGFVTGTAPPATSLDTAYKSILSGGQYTSGASAETVTLNNLTIGHQYVAQLWVDDSRSYGIGRSETLAGGANTAVLDYNTADAVGGVGQFVIGTFTADATTQSLTLTGNASTQLNALQLRDSSSPPALAITAPPQSQAVTAGSDVTLSVGASSALPLAYQWSFNDNPIPAAANATATNSALFLNNVATNQAGFYSVRVSNALTNLASGPAWLSVDPPIDPLDPLVALDAYNTLWTSPSQNDRGAMPLGNGELGLMLWVEPDGDLQFYLARTDSRTELDRLVKLGKVRLRLSPNPFASGQPFLQQLRLRGGRVDITAGSSTNQLTLHAFVDSDSPTLHINGTSSSPLTVQAIYETWRTADYAGNASDSPLGGSGYPNLYESADVVDVADTNRLVFYHRNAWSCVPQTAGFQFMSPYLADVPDTLTNRTFGGWMTLTAAAANGSNALVAATALTNFDLKIATHCAQTPTLSSWLAQLSATNAAALDVAAALQHTALWWTNYWNRSWLFVQGDGPPSNSPPAMGSNNLALRIGADSSGASLFTGAMARASFYNRALASNEVAALALGAPDADAAITNGLVESWLLGSTAGGVCAGRLGSGLNLSLSGNVSLVTNNGVRLAQFNGGFFLGTDDPRFEPTAGATMEAWIRLDAGAANNGRLFDKVTPNQQDGYLFDLYPGRALRLLNGADGVSLASNFLNTNTWLHVVATYDNQTKGKALYLNGSLVAQAGGTSFQDDPTPSSVTRSYVLSKWMTACGARGNFPMMFNGSLWTVNPNTSPITLSNNPDFRSWGHTYFYQNTRHFYHSMLVRGEPDFLQPFFNYYSGFRALNRDRAVAWYGAQGQFVNEMTTSFGLIPGGVYGYSRGGNPNWYCSNPWGGSLTVSPGLEILSLMLDSYDYSGDAAFLQTTIAPYAQDLMRFVETAYPARDASGDIVIGPINTVEAYWNSTNATTVVSGMSAALDRLLALPSGLLAPTQATYFASIKAMTPPVPLQQVNAQTIFAPAQAWGARQQVEEPELYPVFPFRLYGIGRTNRTLGINTFQQVAIGRGYFKPFVLGGGTSQDSYSGWQQSGMEAALLGLTDYAQTALTGNCQLFNSGYRFRGMWGQIYDSIPDGDHGANVLNTAQLMAFQTLGDKIFLLPAWPRDWNLSFKFQAPHATTVSGTYSNGVIQQLEVVPPSRVNDLILMLTNVPVLAVGSATVTGYDAWRLSHYAGQDLANTSAWAPDADPDGDGLPNAMEYLLAGMDPMVPNPMPMPTLVQVGGQDYLQMQLLKNPSATFGSASLQMSYDLTHWFAPVSSGDGNIIVMNDVTQFTVQLRRSAVPDSFFRIVAQP